MKLRMLLCGVMTLLVIGQDSLFAFTVTLQSQNFDDTATYFPGMTGVVGSSLDTGGRWGSFDAFSNIDDSVSVSGGQSLVAIRGGQPIFGRSEMAILSRQYELSYWIRRKTEQSAFIGQFISATNNLDVSISTYTDPDGNLNYFDPTAGSAGTGGWVNSGGVVPVAEWNRIRLYVDEVAGSYDLFLMPEGGEEAYLTTVFPGAFPVAIDRFRPTMQGTLLSETNVDDVLMTFEADPSFADFDADGDVDGRDFLSWQRGFGITGTATKADGDTDNDKNVDNADLLGWQLYYAVPELPATGPTSVAVPEPRAEYLVVLALILIALIRIRTPWVGSGLLV